MRILLILLCVMWMGGSVEAKLKKGPWPSDPELAKVEQEIQEVIKKMERPYQELAVMAVAPPEAGVHMETRRGTLLIACVEQNENLSDVLEKYNADCHPLHRIKGVALLDSLPRTGIGKISYPELELLLKSER
mgnify:CR=1 FL=1